MRGEGRALGRFERTVQRVAATEMNVLISGQPGNGTLQLAKAIHRASERTQEPLYEFSAAEMTFEAIAQRASGNGIRPGLKGTLLIEEADCLDAGAQAGLLEVLEKGTWSDGDSGRRVQTDVRILVTASDLKGAVERGEFRADLYYRLAEIVLEAETESENGNRSLKEVIEDVGQKAETELIRRAIERHGGDLHRAAGALAISYGRLWQKMQQLEIRP